MVEPRLVMPVVVGSSPIIHPSLEDFPVADTSKVAR